MYRSLSARGHCLSVEKAPFSFGPSFAEKVRLNQIGPFLVHTVALLMVTHPEICTFTLLALSNCYFPGLPFCGCWITYCARQNTFIGVFVCRSNIRLPCTRPAERKTRVVIRTNDKFVSGDIIAIFLDRGFLICTVSNKTTVLLDVDAP